jgi:hypothetical protein
VIGARHYFVVAAESYRRRVAHHAWPAAAFEQRYNAQAAVAAGSMLVVAVDVVQAPNDKQQIEPMLGGTPAALLGRVEAPNIQLRWRSLWGVASY